MSWQFRIKDFSIACPVQHLHFHSWNQKSSQPTSAMKPSTIFASLAVHFVIVSSMYNHRINRRQEEDSSEDRRGFLYILEMCSPDTQRVIESEDFSGHIFPHLANSSFPCDQIDYILGSCMANATNPAVDFAAEQQCLVSQLFELCAISPPQSSPPKSAFWGTLLTVHSVEVTWWTPGLAVGTAIVPAAFDSAMRL